MAPSPPFLTGKLLLAMPGIGDPRFERSVIAMCQHDEEGALGIGIGRIMPRLGLHGLLGQFGIEPGSAPDVPIHAGGPVEPQRGFVLHSLDWSGQDSMQVSNLWGLTATIDVLRVIGTDKGPRHWLVALAYAGWGPGPLDEETHRHGWPVAAPVNRCASTVRAAPAKVGRSPMFTAAGNSRPSGSTATAA